MNRMKIIAVMMVCALSLNCMAQSVDSKQIQKMARKEAKKLKKEGWLITPGTLPLEIQLERAYNSELNSDEAMVLGESQSIAQNYDAGKIQAMELARQEIAGKIGSQTTAIVDNLVGNKQMGAEEAATITTLLSKGKTIYSQKIGRIQILIECYRVLENKNKEVLVRVATKESEVKEAIKDYLREEMEKKGEKMNDNLVKMLSSK